MQEEFIFANPQCYIEEQLSNGRTLYCFREKGTNRIVIIETQNEQESKDVSGYIRPSPSFSQREPEAS